MVGPRKREPLTVISLRISPRLLKAIHDFVLDYNTAHFKPGFSMGLPEVTTDALALRWAVEAGLPELREQLHEYQAQKGKGSGVSADYTQEKLWQAVETLITSRAPIQQRLASAALYLTRLRHGRPEDRAFSDPELQARLEKVIHDLTCVPAAANEGTIEATTRQLTDEAGSRIAGEILSLFCVASALATIPVGFPDEWKGTRKGR